MESGPTAYEQFVVEQVGLDAITEKSAIIKVSLAAGVLTNPP